MGHDLDPSQPRPELWPLDPDVAFLNHGSFGACPKAVLAYQQRLRDELEQQPVRFFLDGFGERVDAALGALGRFLGAAGDDLAFVDNATAGVNAVLKSLRLRLGDELLVTDHEYNACRNALDLVAHDAAARVVVVEVPFPIDSADRVVDLVLAKVTGRTRLALLDHVTSPTGLVLPIERLIAELKEHGVDTLVDGAHAPGMVDLDIGRLDPAYYTGNCHKWLCAPKAAGFLYVRRDLQQTCRPLVTSHGANADDSVRSRFRLEFDWPGTHDPTPYLCVPEAIRYLEASFPGGWPELRERNRMLALEARNLLVDALGAPLPCPDDMIGSLAAVPLPDGPATPPTSALYSEPLREELLRKYRIEVPVVPWPAPPKRLVRVSAQLYNARDQYRRLADALVELLGL